MFCRDKDTFVATNTCFFDATKTIPVAAPATDTNHTHTNTANDTNHTHQHQPQDSHFYLRQASLSGKPDVSSENQQRHKPRHTRHKRRPMRKQVSGPLGVDVSGSVGGDFRQEIVVGVEVEDENGARRCHGQRHAE